MELKVLDLREGMCDFFIQGSFRTRVRNLILHSLPPPKAPLLVLEDEETRAELLASSNGLYPDTKTWLRSLDRHAVTVYGSSSELEADYAGQVILSPDEPSEQGVLWETNPLLRKFIDMQQSGCEQTLRHLTVLEAGAGSGRDAISMARLGATVFAIEPRKPLGEACATLCKLYKVSCQIVDDVAELQRLAEKEPQERKPTVYVVHRKIDSEFLTKLGRVDLVHICRFFDRALFPQLMRETCGTWFLCHHFLRGSCRPVKDHQVLADEQELATMAHANGVVPVLDETLELTDHVGFRRLSMFVGRKLPDI